MHCKRRDHNIDFDSPGMNDLYEKFMFEIIEDFLKRVPVGRTGGADDIAKVVLFLASGASDYMCGEMVVVDGGHLMA